MKKSMIVLSFFTFLLIGSYESQATREILMPVNELARTSVDVVVAECISTETKKDEQTGLIFTYTTFDVSESLKGVYDKEIELRIVGGTVGEVTVNVPDVPVFNPDEEVVLFIGPTNTKGYPVLQSIYRGVYRIQTDETGAKVVTGSVSGLEMTSAGINERSNENNRVYLKDFLNSMSQAM